MLKKRFDLICIGDSTEDVYVKLNDKKNYFSLRKNFLCLAYPDKVPAESVHKLVGGNASNTAVGAARLKLKTGLYSILGDDLAGKKVLDDLKNMLARNINSAMSLLPTPAKVIAILSSTSTSIDIARSRSSLVNIKSPSFIGVRDTDMIMASFIK